MNCPPLVAYPSALGLRPSPFVLLAVLLLAGCTPTDTKPPEPTKPPLAGVKLRLAVLDDPAIATAAGKLGGEWTAQTGGELEVTTIDAKSLAAAKTLPADALIAPSCLLGELVDRELIAPLPEKPLHSEGGQWRDIFELLRDREAAWGRAVMAVPFGSPVLVCYYRADLLEKLGRRPPKTWAEYQELAQLLADRKNLGAAAPPAGAPWSGTLEPLAPGWAGLVLLARAAPYAKHRENYSTLFDMQTMEPLVAGPPMVQALEELVAAAKLSPAEAAKSDPAAVRTAFWQGHAGMALTWPSAAPPAIAAEKGIRVGFVELFGAPQVYNVGNKAWETRATEEDSRVPLLGAAGRIGVVGHSAPQPQAAVQLLLWLAGTQNSTQVSATSAATTLFRRSQVKFPTVWTEKPIPPLPAGDYAALVETALSRSQWLLAPRIPGHDEYMAALDEAVAAAVKGDRPAAEALKQAAARWREITRRRGVEHQRDAYERSLGLE